jgi:hypothetical protein
MLRTAEEILTENDIAIDKWPDTKALIIKAINDARKEAIKECAEVATLNYKVYSVDGNYETSDVGGEVQIVEPNEYITVNTQSILKLLDQIK